MIPSTRRCRRASWRALPALAVLALSVAASGACSTSGRELREPAFRQPAFLPATSASTTTSALIEGLDGFALTSPEVAPGGVLPVDTGARHGNRSPALSWSATPVRAAELALVMSNAAGDNVYWLVTGIPAADGTIPSGGTAPEGATVLPNSEGHARYDGPVAASGTSVSVVVRLYALAQPLQLDRTLSAEDAVEAIASAAFATATLSVAYVGDEGAPQTS